MEEIMPRRILTLSLVILFAVACRGKEKPTSQEANTVAEKSTDATTKTGAGPVADAPKGDIKPPTTYGVGERLKYKLTWNRMSVGTMEISISPKVTVAGQPAWKFHLKAGTNSFADSIYKVRLNLKSYVDDARTCSLRYQSDSTEGSRSKIKKFEFDWKKMKVHYLKNRKEDRGWRDLEAKSFDPLAMFYALREMPIDETTKELSVWVSDGKKNLNATATIVRRERVKDANDKSHDTYLVEPDLKDLKGVFEKSKDAKLQIWVSTDKYRIPVKISSKVSIGSFTATLTEHVAHDR
jgi:hypothetical protein